MHHGGEDAAFALAEAGGDEARMQAVCRYASPGEAVRKFAREQYVGELGAPVRGHSAIVLFHLKIVEIEGVAPPMPY
jgi:hypothetical protein